MSSMSSYSTNVLRFFLEALVSHLPCVTRLTLVVTGLSFLQPVLTATQFEKMTLIARQWVYSLAHVPKDFFRKFKLD